jgi:hypothetical protein
MEVYSEMLRSKSTEGDYFKNRIDELVAYAKDLETRFRSLGGVVSRLD